MVTCLSLPTVAGTLVTAVQLDVAAVGFCSSEKPVDGDGQATITVLVLLRTTRNNGPPGV